MAKRLPEQFKLTSDQNPDVRRCRSALQRIGALERSIAGKEEESSHDIDRIRERLVDNTAEERAVLAANEAALKQWAKEDAKTWPAKSLELNFGTIGFRRPQPAIKLKLAVANVIERLRARKMISCIRTVEEVDKEKLASYDDAVLQSVGCERTKPKDKFWYECKQEAVR